MVAYNYAAFSWVGEGCLGFPRTGDICGINCIHFSGSVERMAQDSITFPGAGHIAGIEFYYVS